MKINIQTNNVILTSKQKALIERKIAKLKKYFNSSEAEHVMIDVLLIDDTGVEKGGIDQKVHINVANGKEKIFIEEVDDRIMRAFSYALERIERQLRRNHQMKVDRSRKIGESRLEKVFGVIKRKK